MTNKKIKVVLSGSGTRYPAHIGGLIRLVEAGYEIEEICGTSGGAIVAAGISSGYPVGPKLIDMMKELLPSKQNLISYSVKSLFSQWGLVKGDKLTELFKRYAPKQFSETTIPLHVVTTCLERRAPKVFSTVNTPDSCVATAVRASMSIPGIFAPVKIDKRYYVDGGLTGNFMLDIFGTGQNVFGLKFKDVNSFNTLQGQGGSPIRGIADYIDANIEAMLNASAREHIRGDIYARTIILDTKHGSLNFKMSEADIDEMVDDGWNSVDKALKKM